MEDEEIHDWQKPLQETMAGFERLIPRLRISVYLSVGGLLFQIPGFINAYLAEVPLWVKCLMFAISVALCLWMLKLIISSVRSLRHLIKCRRSVLLVIQSKNTSQLEHHSQEALAALNEFEKS